MHTIPGVWHRPASMRAIFVNFIRQIASWFARFRPAPVVHVNLSANFGVERDADDHLVVTLADDATLLQITLAPEHTAVFVDIGLDSLMLTEPDVIAMTDAINPDDKTLRMH